MGSGFKERNVEEAEEEDEEEEEEGEKTAKELDDEIKRKKERQIFLDDVGVLVAMVTIKVVIFQPTYDDTITTFSPVLQVKDSKIKYTGNGFIPCKGYVPCKTVEPND